ncbi:MAG: hypothetical protein WBA23_16280 [Tunicatimonas sp.]|uniref:hypothetical protein n=1 Tax=Tunicatimonas sp. TaxID=1940096 RepID=UPI003C729284
MNRLLLLIGYLLLGCIEQLIEHRSIRRLVNETPYEVTVEVFEYDTRYTYQLPPADSVDIPGVCTSGLETYCALDWEGNFENATITFGEERIQQFALPNNRDEKAINGDPSEGFGYVLTSEGLFDNQTRIYTYRITQEDYNQAEEIDN